MQSQRQYPRVDTAELKDRLFKKLGKQKSEMYFHYLKRLLGSKISKLEFEKSCFSLIGKENVGLHNVFIKSILRNACLALGPPSKHKVTGHLETTKESDICDVLPQSKDQRLNNGQSLSGSRGKTHFGKGGDGIISSCSQRFKEQQSLPELISVGSKAPLDVASVEDGEEVEQARGSPCVQSSSPLIPPLGILHTGGGLSRKAIRSSSKLAFPPYKSRVPESCHGSFVLPDSRSLKRKLEQMLESEGLDVTVDCANLLNHGLDAFLRRLIRPCLDMAKARCNTSRVNQLSMNNFPSRNVPWKMDDIQMSNQSYHASMLDFRVAMELNPSILGSDWASEMERISSYTWQSEM